MAEAREQNQVTLPSGLRERFGALQSRLWRIETIVAVGTAALGLAASYLILFAADRVWDSAAAVRLAAACGGLAGLGWAATRWCRRWIIRRRGSRALAALVQEKYPLLGDRLLGIVELTEEQHRPADFSPALCRAAIKQVAAEAAAYDFREAVSPRPAKRLLAMLSGLGIVVLLAVALVPAAAWNTFQRWVSPLGHIARYTLVRLEGLPPQKIVPLGEPFEVDFSVGYHSFWRPARVTAQYGSQPELHAQVTEAGSAPKMPPHPGPLPLREGESAHSLLPVPGMPTGPLSRRGGEGARRAGEGEATHLYPSGRTKFMEAHIEVPGQVEANQLKIRVGDARGSVAVQPTPRPSLRELKALITLPEYLRYPTLTVEVQNGSLGVLAGSKVAFRGRLTRELERAELRLGEREPVALTVGDETFSSAAMDLNGVSYCTFSWRDTLGLEGAMPWRLAVQLQPDLPPAPALPKLERELAILASEVLEIAVAARDDFGVRHLGLAWEVVSSRGETDAVAAQVFEAPAPTSQDKDFVTTFQFSPTVLRIPPDSIVEVHATATDYYPGRPPAVSPVCRIHVIGVERHAELVRQRLESLLVQLEELTRLEGRITEDTRALGQLPEGKLAGKETDRQLGELETDQSQNARDLTGLAEEGAQVMREALANPVLSAHALREWSKSLQMMQGLAQQEMPAAAQHLQSAQQNSENRSQAIAQALATEEAILEALSRLQQRLVRSLDQLQALTLAQRLRKLGTAEQDIGTALQQAVPETIGLFPEDLPPRFQRRNAYLAEDQQYTQNEAQVLQGEISRFHERTQREAYGEVSRSMTEARTVEELERLGGLIQHNVSMMAMQGLTQWSRRFEEWADKLEPKPDSGGGGGGGGGGGNVMQELLTEQLIALLRLRDREINLRERTRLVEAQKAQREAYEELAEALLSGQQGLSAELATVQRHNLVSLLEEPLAETAAAMGQVESLLGIPQTDAATVKAETHTIERLSDAINLLNEQAQRGGSGQSSAEELAFLIKMLTQQLGMTPGMQVAPTAGGNLAGGTTDQLATPSEGDASGKPGGPRGVAKTAGRTQNLPTEFREALEAYFKAIE